MENMNKNCKNFTDFSAVVGICPTIFSPPELVQAKSVNATLRKERLGGRKGDSHYGCASLR